MPTPQTIGVRTSRLVPVTGDVRVPGTELYLRFYANRAYVRSIDSPNGVKVLEGPLSLTRSPLARRALARLLAGLNRHGDLLADPHRATLRVTLRPQLRDDGTTVPGHFNLWLRHTAPPSVLRDDAGADEHAASTEREMTNITEPDGLFVFFDHRRNTNVLSYAERGELIKLTYLTQRGDALSARQQQRRDYLSSRSLKELLS